MNRHLVVVSLLLLASGCATIRWRAEGTIPPPPGTPPAPPPVAEGRPLMSKDDAVARSKEYASARGYHHSKVEEVELEDGGRIWQVELRLHGRTKGEVELAYDRQTHQLVAVDEDIERHTPKDGKGHADADDDDGRGKHGKGKGKGHEKDKAEKHARGDE